MLTLELGILKSCWKISGLLEADIPQETANPLVLNCNFKQESYKILVWVTEGTSTFCR